MPHNISQAAPKPKPWSVVDACDTWHSHVQGMEQVMRQYSNPKNGGKIVNPTKRVVNHGKSKHFINLYLSWEFLLL